MTAYRTRRPAALEDRPPRQRWLVRDLWGAQAVGIIGGEPKCGKSFLALDMAVSVATGVACLREFDAMQRGPVVLFAAEDAGHIVRARLADIARVAGADFNALDIAVIDAPSVRLDRARDRTRLRETVARVKPRLLVLDPFVRLHAVNENDAADMAPVLAFLRELQRLYGTAVALVHHARKGGATRPGQALRGSSDLHAWGDSNLYLRRRTSSIVMTVEHRAAPGIDGVALELADDGQGLALRLAGEAAGEAGGETETERRIMRVLESAGGAVSQRQIRERASLRSSAVTDTLRGLIEQGRAEHTPKVGYRAVPVPA